MKAKFYIGFSAETPAGSSHNLAASISPTHGEADALLSGTRTFFHFFSPHFPFLSQCTA
jgi:hypothetical protein